MVGPGKLGMEKSVFTEEYQALVRLLVEQRKSAGLTQEELARRLRKPQSFVSKYENGQRRLDIVEFLAIANALDADPHPIVEKVRRGLKR